MDGVEQTLLGELFLELFEGHLERAATQRLQMIHHQLDLPSRCIDRDRAPSQKLHTALGLKLQVAAAHAETYGRDLCVRVLEGEVEVARRGNSQVGNLALDPDVAESGLQPGLDLVDDLRNGQDPALSRLFELSHHVELFHSGPGLFLPNA